MARRAQPRANYRTEALTVNRILAAVEVDKISSLDWTGEVSWRLEEVFKLMVMTARERQNYMKVSKAS